MLDEPIFVKINEYLKECEVYDYYMANRIQDSVENILGLKDELQLNEILLFANNIDVNWHVDIILVTTKGIRGCYNILENFRRGGLNILEKFENEHHNINILHADWFKTEEYYTDFIYKMIKDESISLWVKSDVESILNMTEPDDLRLFKVYSRVRHGYSNIFNPNSYGEHALFLKNSMKDLLVEYDNFRCQDILNTKNAFIVVKYALQEYAFLTMPFNKTFSEKMSNIARTCNLVWLAETLYLPLLVEYQDILTDMSLNAYSEVMNDYYTLKYSVVEMCRVAVKSFSILYKELIQVAEKEYKENTEINELNSKHKAHSKINKADRR